MSEELLVTRGWRERLESLGGRRRDVRVVALVVVGAVVVALALWARSAPPVIAPPSTIPYADPSAADTSGAVGATPSGTVVVDVSGAVKKPGVYSLAMGARVQDAIDAAGGPTRRAHLEVLNLAEIVADGAKVDVPHRGQPLAPVPGMSGTSAAPGLVNLNTADETALESIPNVGPVTAGAILKYRAQIGSFSSVDQLLQVSGIGPATLDSIRPYVTV